MPRSADDLSIDKIRKTADEYVITQPIFIDNEQKLTNAFNNKYVPAYYLFDMEGKLRHFQAGGSGAQLLEMRVDRIIAENQKSK